MPLTPPHDVHSPFSPAQERFRRMQLEGTCVTAYHGLRAEPEGAAPPTTVRETVPGSALLPTPTDNSMPDG